MLLHEKRDVKKIYLEKLEYMKAVSCKQCVPCKIGTKKLCRAASDLIRKFERLQSS